MKRVLFSAIILCLTFCSNAQVRLPAILSDNMVLQQEMEAPIWGWASPGETVTIKVNWAKAKEEKVTANAKGEWDTSLKTPRAGGPYTIEISGKNTLTIHNVLIGEVWVCSGQSNMEMPVEGWGEQIILNSAEEIKNAKYPEIRLFTVKKAIAVIPQKDVEGEWVVATPENVAKFSATGYFFGKMLHKDLKEPVGLIHTSWGGTVAEAWTNEKGLRELGDFDKELNTLDSIVPILEDVKKNDLMAKSKWQKDITTPEAQYAEKDYDYSSWKTMQVPVKWEEAGLPDFDGIVWFRTSIAIPENWAGKSLNLELGPIDDLDITYFNGKKIGETKEEGFYWAAERKYTIPSALVKAGKNEIAVRVVDLGGTGGIYGEANQLIIYPVDGKKENGIRLAKDWGYHIERKAPKTFFSENPNQPTVLYNAMLAPIIPYGIKGAIWYQGESNVGRAGQYEKLFPLMIKSWRHAWKQGDFPFYYAQIAPFGYLGSGSESAALRDAQRKSLKTKNTGMAVLLDIGSLKTIHPPNKEEVGRRLALIALNKTYGQDVVYSGPTIANAKAKNGKLILQFENVEDGLQVQGAPDAFEIAGSDKQFYSAEANVGKDTVILSSKNVDAPVFARYAWKDKAKAEIFNTAGLPASSFEVSINSIK